MNNRSLVILPSYNEKENIDALISSILNQNPNYDVCVVDDNSPDKTADVIRQKFSNELGKRLELIVRQKKDGRGGAVREGIKWGLNNPSHPYAAFIEMDCDFSHPPEDISRGVQMLREYDVVLGSRYPDGEIRGWPLRRKVLSYFANLLARVLISWKIGDYTNGFRFYTRRSAELMLNLPQRHKGYIYLSETLANFLKRDFKIGTFPILFINRERGVSNTTFKEVFSAFRGIFDIAREYRRG